MTKTYLRAVIIDSARGARRLDNTRSSPYSLELVESRRTVLDWILHALSSCGVGQVTYVGGYHIQKVIERYPSLSYRFQSNWERHGELGGLALASPQGPGDCLVIRASTICVPEALRRLTTAGEGLSVGYHSDEERQRFTGLMLLPATEAQAAFAIADSIGTSDPPPNLEEWLSAMEEGGLRLHRVDLDGLAAPLRDPAAVARTVFGGKGRTLEQLGPLIRSAEVPEQVRFRAADWQDDPEPIGAEIRRVFTNAQVAVRSSAYAEDGLRASSAGRFVSVLDIPADQTGSVSAAVNEVIASYTNDGRVLHSMDQVFVQRHIGDLEASGVLLTRDLETGAPYYVLNIDRHSGRSDLVTSGGEANVDTLYISRSGDAGGLAPDVQVCLKLARELEEMTHLDDLDIEFGIGRGGEVFLFQVRPIASSARNFQLADDDLTEELDRVREFLDAHMQPHPTLAGDTTVLGTMPDWNPAEMIGTAPRPLALSLYQRLIGDEAWAVARALLGYRDVRPEPLIVTLAGRPYVDVRASLNSFLPDGLDDGAAQTWVNYCLEMLREDSRLHDKIEFEVAITCLAFDFDSHAQRLRAAGLSETQIGQFRGNLLQITDDILTEQVTPIESQLSQLKVLATRRRRWLESPASDTTALARRISVILDDCERYGVVPFSVLARYAFIALSLVRSLNRVGIFTDDEREALLNSIPTVASDLSWDLVEHKAGQLPTEVMLERYGHLRPSSYDITSPNYASAWNTYISGIGESARDMAYPDISVATEIFDKHAVQIETSMRALGFTASVDQLRSFVLHSIPSRERAKFEFMKSVDAALEGIATLGNGLGFSREEMSYLPADQVVRSGKDSASGALRTEFRRAIEFNKKRWNLTCATRLPHLVRSKADVAGFRMEEWAPNFISSKRVVAPPVVVEAGLPSTSLEGRIALIRAADPGYDWLFSHAIAGLITQYGGVASHMAIRAAEFGLPAAIGCGELVFDRLRSASLVELDCTTKKVRALG